MTAVEFSPQERARLDAIEAAQPAPESLRERVAAALWEAQQGVHVTPWGELSSMSPTRDNYRQYADAALAVVKGDPS